VRRLAGLSVVAALALGGGCRSYPPTEEVASSSPTSVVEVTSTARATSAPVSTTRAGSTDTTARPAPASTRATVVATVPPAPATTAAPVLSAAEASGKLCDAVISGDAAVRAGNLVAGGLRLAGGISTYGDAAVPAVSGAARAMLSAGRAGDDEGYVVARSGAATACAPFGRTVPTGGLRCIQAPCP
jgi:hypothetical protein